MSLAHFSSSNHQYHHHLPETLWYPPYPIMDSHPKIPNQSGLNFNINTTTNYADDNNNNQQDTKETMFEKPLTPSDVGKLNRLVIPKQHAEKYFPLANGNGNGNGNGGDTDQQQQQKGLLLSFEDEDGKPWRFRYSYWNSSQSYVLTKGWSRFVKEKRLDAGDVVFFERHRFDCDRLFIGWRRRPAAAAVVPMLDGVAVAGGGGGGQMVNNGWTTTSSRGFYDAHYNYPSHHHHHHHHLPHPYQPHCLHAAGGGINDNVENKQRSDMVSASGNPRRVRLFGVNLECPDESEPSTPDGSSHGQTHYQYHNNLNLNHDMNINFSQMRYQQHQG